MEVGDDMRELYHGHAGHGSSQPDRHGLPAIVEAARVVKPQGAFASNAHSNANAGIQVRDGRPVGL